MVTGYGERVQAEDVSEVMLRECSSKLALIAGNECRLANQSSSRWCCYCQILLSECVYKYTVGVRVRLSNRCLCSVCCRNGIPYIRKEGENKAAGIRGAGLRGCHVTCCDSRGKKLQAFQWSVRCFSLRQQRRQRHSGRLRETRAQWLAS